MSEPSEGQLAATRHEGRPKPHQIVATTARLIASGGTAASSAAEGQRGLIASGGTAASSAAEGQRGLIDADKPKRLGQLELHADELRFGSRLPGAGGWLAWMVGHKLEPTLAMPLADIASYEVLGAEAKELAVTTTGGVTHRFEVEDARGWFGVLQGTGVPQLGVELIFPDDDGVASGLRSADRALGLLEQAFLFALLCIIVVTASTAALSDKLAHHHLGRWWFTVVRGGTFTIALIGAVFATHQQRHLAMDLVSRRLSPRGRLVLGVLLKLFTIGIALLLLRSGLHQRDTIGGTGEELVSDKTIVTAMPLAAVMIIVHSVLHLVIDVDYLARGKTPPERARSGH